MEENDIEIFDISVPVTNEDEFFRACLAAEYTKYLEKTAKSNGLKLDPSEIQKVFFRQFNYENVSKEQCVKELYRIRLNEYQHNYIRSGYKPTRQQKNVVRDVLESELSKTADLKTDLDKLPKNFVSKYLLEDSRGEKSRREPVSFKKIYSNVCSRYGIKKEKNIGSDLSRRQFFKLGAGLGATIIGGGIVNSLVNTPRGEAKSESDTKSSAHNSDSLKNNSPDERFKHAINMIYENSSLFSKLGLTYIAGDKFAEYINQRNLLAEGWQPSGEEKSNYDTLRKNIVDMITTTKLDSAVFKGFYQSPGLYEINANDRAVAQVNFEINGEEYQFTDTDLINGSHLASTKAYVNSYNQKQNSPIETDTSSTHDDLDSAVYEAVAFALLDLDINLDSNEITETPNTKLVDEIIDNTKTNSHER